jgi:hypothetical protein
MIVPPNQVRLNEPPFRFAYNRFGFFYVPFVLNARLRVGRRTWPLDRA